MKHTHTTYSPRRHALHALAATFTGCLLGTPARAQTAWLPSQNMTYVIGVAAGGSVDLYARGIKTALETLNLTNGHTVLPENKPGAGGLLALQHLQRNRNNAHHLGTFHTGSIAGQVAGVLKADMRDYVPVAMMVEETTLVAVDTNSPLKTAADIAAQLKRDPASLRIAVAPLKGLNTHLAIAKPLKAAGVDVSKLTVVPFRSSGDSMVALLGGHVDIVSATAPTVVPQTANGKVRMLVSAAPVRGSGPLAGVPTWREMGVAADYVSYNGVLLAPGVDAEQIRFWKSALKQVSESAEWKALVEKSGNKPMFKGYVDSHRYLKAELQETQSLFRRFEFWGWLVSTPQAHQKQLDADGEWACELAELHLRPRQASAMGGSEALAKFKASGRLNARERIAKLIDAGSFRELGALAGKAHYSREGVFERIDPTNAIVGTARIDGRKVGIHADDFTIRAGSSEATIADKWIYIEPMAHQLRFPLVRLVDSAGGSVKPLLQLGGAKIPEYPNWPVNELLHTVPVVGVALGSCAGQGAVKVLSSHFSVMVRQQAQVMAAGPHVVKQAYAQDVDKNELGGHLVHRKSALVHNEAEDEIDALDQVRRFLSYMPRSVFHTAPVLPADDDPNRADDWLKNAIPRDRRKIYEPRKILTSVMDQRSLFEIGRYQGGSVITALARLNGVPVGVIANDPKVHGGAMTNQAAYKMERHIKLCSLFGLPVVNFVDQPGNQTGLDAELSGTLLGAIRVGEALHDCKSPWISIMLRRCFGMAGALHAPKYGEALNLRYAWPSARWGSIPIEGGVMAAHKTEIEEATDPAAKRAELEAFYLNMTSPFRTAEKFGILDIIDPRETRSVLCDWVEDAWARIQVDKI